MNTKNKPVKPRKMWAVDFIGADAILSRLCVPSLKHRNDKMYRPVLVIDLSPESITELSLKLANAIWPQHNIRSSFDAEERGFNPRAMHILAAIGIKATKPRKSKKESRHEHH